MHNKNTEIIIPSKEFRSPSDIISSVGYSNILSISCLTYDEDKLEEHFLDAEKHIIKSNNIEKGQVAITSVLSML